MMEDSQDFCSIMPYCKVQILVFVTLAISLRVACHISQGNSTVARYGQPCNYPVLFIEQRGL